MNGTDFLATLIAVALLIIAGVTLVRHYLNEVPKPKPFQQPLGFRIIKRSVYDWQQKKGFPND